MPDGVLKPDCLNIVWFMRGLPDARLAEIEQEAVAAADTIRAVRQVQRLFAYLRYCSHARDLVSLLHVHPLPDDPQFEARVAHALDAVLAAMRDPRVRGWVAPAHEKRWRTHVRRALESIQSDGHRSRTLSQSASPPVAPVAARSRQGDL